MHTIDEVQELTAKVDAQGPKIWLKQGKTYKFKRSYPEYQVPFTRKKMHINEETGTAYPCTHDMMLIGKDGAFWCRDDRNRMVIYHDHADKDRQNELFGHEIWNHLHQQGDLQSRLATMRGH